MIEETIYTFKKNAQTDEYGSIIMKIILLTLRFLIFRRPQQTEDAQDGYKPNIKYVKLGTTDQELEHI